GSGKTTLSCLFAEAVCKRGDRCLYIGFEESQGQIARNLGSLGVDLQPWIKKNLLIHRAWRPTQYGMEMHLLRIHRLGEDFKPRAVVIDPISNLITTGTQRDTSAMLMRLIDFLKNQGITAVFTSLTHGGSNLESTQDGTSSLIDTWILLRD